MMNERIKELAEQADLYARSDNSSMVFENFMSRYTEKLTELVIRECITLNDIQKDIAIDESWNVDEAMSTAGLDILDHFGLSI